MMKSVNNCNRILVFTKFSRQGSIKKTLFRAKLPPKRTATTHSKALERQEYHPFLMLNIKQGSSKTQYLKYLV